MSRTEPELPSIITPLAHESGIGTELARTNIESQHDAVALPAAVEPSAEQNPACCESRYQPSAALLLPNQPATPALLTAFHRGSSHTPRLVPSSRH